MNAHERERVASLVAAISGRLLVEHATDLGEAELQRCLSDCAAPFLCMHIGRYMREGLKASAADLERFSAGFTLPADAPALMPFSWEHEHTRRHADHLRSRIAFVVYRDALVAAAKGEPVYIGAAADELGPELVRLAGVSECGIEGHVATPLGCAVATLLQLECRDFILAEARRCADG